MLIGEPEDLWLLATDAGYGFTRATEGAAFAQSRRQGGAEAHAGALVLPPASLRCRCWRGGAGSQRADARVALVNSEGRLLLLPASEVPELPRGKGNKLFGIPTKKAESREETLVADDRAVRRAQSLRGVIG